MSTSSNATRGCVVCAYPAASRCSGCGKAYYCSQEHQKSAWEKHKRLCKIYQATAKGEPAPSTDSYCGLCGRSDGPLTKTYCCNRTVCDDQENYQMFSYSRISCGRNHEKYSRCYWHSGQAHEGDVFTCIECDNSHDDEIAASYMTSNYNFQEDIDRAKPPSFSPTHCCKCGRAMKLSEGFSASFGSQGVTCPRCK